MRFWLGVLLLLGVMQAREEALLQAVKLKITLENHTRQSALGVWLKGGYILTSALAVHQSEPLVYAKRIEVLIVDEITQPLIAFGEARVVALDEDRGVALLHLERFSDMYGNHLAKTPFHESVLERRGVELGSYLRGELGEFGGRWRPVEQAWGDLRLQDGLVGIVGAERLGTPWWSDRGEFEGLSVAPLDNSMEMRRIETGEIEAFLCSLVERGLIFTQEESTLWRCSASPLKARD